MNMFKETGYWELVFEFVVLITLRKIFGINCQKVSFTSTLKGNPRKI